MNEKTLLFISILGSLLGIALLFLFIENLDYQEETIEKITQERIDEMIKVKGEIVSARTAGNVSFLRIRQPSEIDVIVFQNITAYEGEFVEVIGKTEEYQGEAEIIAHRIRVVS